jgi:uncharacterized protein (TIGR03000 family)
MRPAISTSAYTPQADAAVIDVRVPDANAEVKFGDFATQMGGIERRFVSPPLEPGYKYSYEVTARWQDVNGTHEEVRTVSISPGEVASVDFTAPRRERE